MNQSEFIAVTYKLLKAREKSRVCKVRLIGFTSHWLQNWCKIFKPITKRATTIALLLSIVIHILKSALGLCDTDFRALCVGGPDGSPKCLNCSDGYEGDICGR